MIQGEVKFDFKSDGTIEIDASALKATGGSAEVLAFLKDLSNGIEGTFEEKHKPGVTHTHEHGHDHHHIGHG